MRRRGLIRAPGRRRLRHRIRPEVGLEKLREWLGNTVAVLLALAVSPLGLLCAYDVYREMSAPLGRYQPLAAEITSSRVQKSEVSSVGRNASRTSWSVNIDYRYVVDGVAHHSYGNFVGDPSNEQDAQMLVRGPFAVGSDLRVYYDPQRPDDSRLAAGRNYLRIALMFVGAGIFLSPIGIVVGGLRRST